jgi:hypothetical protein
VFAKLTTSRLLKLPRGEEISTRRILYIITEPSKYSSNLKLTMINFAALNVMRYTTDNPLTEDWIKSQNKFERNTTNITISTREGIDFGDEPASDIGVEANDIENQKQFRK